MGQKKLEHSFLDCNFYNFYTDVIIFCTWYHMVIWGVWYKFQINRSKRLKNSAMLKIARQKLQCRTRVINTMPHVLGRVGATVSEWRDICLNDVTSWRQMPPAKNRWPARLCLTHFIRNFHTEQVVSENVSMVFSDDDRASCYWSLSSGKRMGSPEDCERTSRKKLESKFCKLSNQEN